MFLNTNAENAKRLLEMADVIRTRGLAKRSYMDSSGKVCILGAVSFVMLGNYNGDIKNIRDFNAQVYASGQQKIGRACIAAIKKVISEPSIAMYNDAEERTVEDVIMVFEQAAASLKAEDSDGLV